MWPKISQNSFKSYVSIRQIDGIGFRALFSTLWVVLVYFRGMCASEEGSICRLQKPESVLDKLAFWKLSRSPTKIPELNLRYSYLWMHVLIIPTLFSSEPRGVPSDCAGGIRVHLPFLEICIWGYGICPRYPILRVTRLTSAIISPQKGGLPVLRT
jgi:hypothetical protein